MKNLLTILFLFFISCGQKRIPLDSVESIALIQVAHPYLGGRVDSIKLDVKLIPDFLKDFADRKEEIVKFYSCYVIKIRLKNGELISYRTNGTAFEKFLDTSTKATLFTLNKNINLVTKYWGIPSDKFCDKKTSSSIENNFSLEDIEKLNLNYCDTFSIEFPELYPVLTALPNAIDDSSIVATSLKRNGFKVTDFGRGNWEQGPRFIYLKLDKDKCNCTVYKKYFYNEKMSDGKYNLRVTEKLICNSKASMFD